MKKNIAFTGMFIVFVFSLTIFTGCAEKKAVVSEGTAQEQAAPAESAATTKEQSVKAGPAVTIDVVIGDINFDFDQSTIRPDAREILKANADILLRRGAAEVTIEGHCDERGTAEYNMALGERRAQETKKYLVNLGVPTAQIKTISYGEERPSDPGHNEEAWEKNRRAHFVVTR